MVNVGGAEVYHSSVSIQQVLYLILMDEEVFAFWNFLFCLGSILRPKTTSPNISYFSQLEWESIFML